MKLNQELFISKKSLEIILGNLKLMGYKIIGPKLKNGAVVFSEIDSISELPIGYVDVQGPGKYEIKKSGGSYFSYVNGPISLKNFLYPSEVDLLRVEKKGDKIHVLSNTKVAEKQAFIGVRSCDLSALKVLDKALLEYDYVDEQYKLLRNGTFILGVNCVRAGENCFCASMNTGPKLGEGFDLALTELADGFLVKVGSEEGEKVLDGVDVRRASEGEVHQADELVERTARAMTKKVKTSNLKDTLYAQLSNPQWDAVAKRCLSCGNCTMVCPTCFCNDVFDDNDLKSGVTSRKRVWDSCFNVEFAETTAGNARPTIKDRYRQWLMHKMAYWVDQFGVFGCVGCGRCITWCPVGIDITEEVRALRGE